ncbi:MAG: hypothetical protein DRI39_05730 [Chloroflexi bacterium]|nr:MAG: hypothetical protein DRI39_05730 [Chloroflexota bacterium]
MPLWKYAKGNKEVTNEEIDKVLASLICFKCGKELHSDDCPFAKLRDELRALKESPDTSG